MSPGQARGAFNVTIHDVAPRWRAEVTALRAALASWGVTRATLLVVPHFHGQVRLGDDAPTVAWLRARADDGDELALHGYHHQQAGAPAALVDRVRARLWTAGEGECLAPHEDLPSLLARGREQLTRWLGVRPAGFVAPAWLEPRGFAQLLGSLGFAWHETSMYLEALAPRRRAYAPVIGFATRTLTRELASVAWARALLSVRDPDRAQSGRLLRLAVHPADLRSPRVMAALERATRRCVPHLRCVTSGELADQLAA